MSYAIDIVSAAERMRLRTVVENDSRDVSARIASVLNSKKYRGEVADIGAAVRRYASRTSKNRFVAALDFVLA